MAKQKKQSKKIKLAPVVSLRYVAMPSITLEGGLFTRDPQGDQTKRLNDLKTLIETKVMTALTSMKGFLEAQGITITRSEIATSISYDKPALVIAKKKNG